MFPSLLWKKENKRHAVVTRQFFLFSKITIYWCFEERNKHEHHPQNNTKFPSLLLRRRCLTSNQFLIQTYVCSIVVIMGWSFLEESISYLHLSKKHLKYNINYVVNYILVELNKTLKTVNNSITKRYLFKCEFKHCNI